MMLRDLIACLIVIGTTSYGVAAAQPAPAAATDPVRVRPVPPTQRAPVPFEVEKGVILFKAKVADRDVWALLDTGAEYSVLGAGFARGAGFTLTPVARGIETPGGQIPAWRTEGPVGVLLPGIVEVQYPVLPATDLTIMERRHGRPIGFILGQDWLRSFFLFVDPVTRTFTVGPSGRFVPPSDAQVLDIAEAGRPKIGIRVAGHPTIMTLDTGFDGHLTLTPEAWARVVPAGTPLESRQAGSLGGTRATRSAVVPAMAGQVRWEGLRAIESSRPRHWGDGSVGYALLSQFRFAIDVRAGKVWLAPLEPRAQ